jgi:hypothetical protein
MSFLRDLFGKKQTLPKPTVSPKAPPPAPLRTMPPEELASYVQELLKINRSVGLMQVEPGSTDNQLMHRDERGREIGQILCDRGGNALMVLVAKEYVRQGGDEWNISHCWHMLKNKSGSVVWYS